MNNKEKTRSEIDDKYKWDLTTIYKDDKAWEDDYLLAQNKINEIIDYKDSFLDNGTNLYNFLKYDEKTDRLLSKLFYYAHLNFDANTLDDNYKKMLSKISDLFKKYGELSAFVTPEMLKKDMSYYDELIKEESKLNEYKFIFEDLLRFKEHTLDEDKEKMLTSLSGVLSSSEETFEALTDSDLEFPNIKDENGNLVSFNESNYSTFIESKDRRVRKDAFDILLGTYSKFKNTITSCFSNNVECNTVSAKIRGYESAIKASLYSDNVDISVYDNLINTVNSKMDVIYKYYDLKKEVLGLDELHLYDIYTPLIKESNSKYTFLEAKDMVINALGILGPDYVSNIKRAFDEKWIDIYHNKGKRSGAYSSGFYDTNPFVLTNFEGRLNDVSTLAHELGHSMHTYYSCKNNPYQYSSYKIFVAEVASTVNELLLSKYLLENTNDKNERLNILNNLMELFKGTIYRQTMFAEFEKQMHEKREQGEILTSKFISDNYYELVKKYFGPNVVVDDLIRYEWERIPHFYYDFYVYKYATGLSSACYIVNNIIKNGKPAIDSYIKFLSSGGSDYPTEELKIAGVDISKKEVVESAISMFDEVIERFKKEFYKEV